MYTILAMDRRSSFCKSAPTASYCISLKDLSADDLAVAFCWRVIVQAYLMALLCLFTRDEQFVPVLTMEEAWTEQKPDFGGDAEKW